MRYAQRVSAPDTAEENTPATSRTATESESDAAYSVISREQKLKIVGISDLDPDSMRGAARARVFLPLKLAQDLRVMQPSDVRDSMRGFSKQPSYSSERTGEEPQECGRSRRPSSGIQHFFDTRRHAQPAAVLCRARSLPGIFGSWRWPWLQSHREYPGHGIWSGARIGIMKAMAPVTAT